MRLPAAAALMGLAASAGAQSSPYCITKNSDPSSYEKLLACQTGKREELEKGYLKKHGAPAPESLTGKLGEIQKSETEYYLAKHPERAPLGDSLMDDSDLPPDFPKKKPSAPKASPTKVANDDPDLVKLAASLKKKSDNGKKGMTPEMSGEVRAMLKAKQGDLSPDMASFLEAVEKDGSSLTPDAMDKVKDGAQKAHGAGLDLGTDDEMTKFLLNPEKESPGAKPQ